MTAIYGWPEALAEMSFTTIVHFACHPSPHDPQFVVQLYKIRAESWRDAPVVPSRRRKAAGLPLAICEAAFIERPSIFNRVAECLRHA